MQSFILFLLFWLPLRSIYFRGGGRGGTRASSVFRRRRARKAKSNALKLAVFYTRELTAKPFVTMIYRDLVDTVYRALLLTYNTRSFKSTLENQKTFSKFIRAIIFKTKVILNRG